MQLESYSRLGYASRLAFSSACALALAITGCSSSGEETLSEGSGQPDLDSQADAAGHSPSAGGSDAGVTKPPALNDGGVTAPTSPQKPPRADAGMTSEDAGDEPAAPPWPSRDLNYARCMVRLSQAAFLAVSEVPQISCADVLDVPFEHAPEASGAVMKVFRRVYDHDALAHLDLAVAFAGTRDDIGDALRDLQSQIPEPYRNHIDGAPVNPVLTGEERVGKGFDDRWQNHAARVATEVAGAREEGHASLSISLTGHSLGAVVATRAGFDVTASASAQRTEVWSWNAPRVGNSAFAQAYAQTITHCTRSDRGCFQLQQFTRTGDPVHGVPLDAAHPIWNLDSSAEARENSGLPANVALGYCAHTHAPRKALIQVLDNHQLAQWEDDLAALPQDFANCLFQ